MSYKGNINVLTFPILGGGYNSLITRQITSIIEESGAYPLPCHIPKEWNNHKQLISLLMKRIHVFLLTAFMALASSCATKSDLDSLQSQINELKGSKIATIEQQISGIQNSIVTLQSLSTLVNAIQAESSTLKIDLANKEKSLNDQIDNLKKYVDSELGKSQDWATSTFCTLEKYQAVLSELANLKTLISNTDQKTREDLGKAISNSETSMKSWVNSQLSGYYTAAQMDAKIKTLSGDISKLSGELATAKTEMTAAYNQAIEESINKFNGEITEKIASDIKKATDNLQKQIDGLDARVSALEKMIRTIVVIPGYSDGSVGVLDSPKSTMDFIVMPEEAAAAAVNRVSSMELSFVPVINTKATAVTRLKVNDASYADGIMTITFDATSLPADFYSGEARMSAMLSIEDEVSSLSSAFFAVKGIDAVDLSENESANCYIVSDTGKYKFRATEGNSDVVLTDAVSVDVLWETFGTDRDINVGDLIYDVKLKDDYIYFQATGEFGNALIAGRNAEGTILWSWHIWATERPKDEVYKNNIGVVMDRNLGATSSEVGDIRTGGLFYNWGRKDPFVGPSKLPLTTYEYSTSPIAKTTAAIPMTVKYNIIEGEVLQYAKEHPTTPISGTVGSSSFDWFRNSSDPSKTELWGKNKTKNDPCPPGYRIIDTEVIKEGQNAYSISFYRNSYGAFIPTANGRAYYPGNIHNQQDDNSFMLLPNGGGCYYYTSSYHHLFFSTYSYGWTVYSSSASYNPCYVRCQLIK